MGCGVWGVGHRDWDGWVRVATVATAIHGSTGSSQQIARGTVTVGLRRQHRALSLSRTQTVGRRDSYCIVPARHRELFSVNRCRVTRRASTSDTTLCSSRVHTSYIISFLNICISDCRSGPHIDASWCRSIRTIGGISGEPPTPDTMAVFDETVTENIRAVSASMMASMAHTLSDRCFPGCCAVSSGNELTSVNVRHQFVSTNVSQRASLETTGPATSHGQWCGGRSLSTLVSPVCGMGALVPNCTIPITLPWMSASLKPPSVAPSCMNSWI